MTNQKKASPFTITSKRENCTLIDYVIDAKPWGGMNHNYIEVACEYDKKTFLPTEWQYRLLRNPDDQLANWTGTPTNYVSQESIDAAQSLVCKSILKVKTAINKGKKHPAYKAMLVIANKKLRHFTDDFFFHDTWTLGRENPSNFIWMIRMTGTWLLNEHGKFCDGIIDYQKKNHENELYYWDGVTLSQFGENDLDRRYGKLKVREQEK
jgi:hypothetical protein